jgi:threonyl-tRNA synthetase
MHRCATTHITLHIQGFIDYAMHVRDKLHAEGFYVDVDDSTKTLNKKVREAETAHYNFVLVVGAAERDTDEVNCRETGNKEVQARNMKVSEMITVMHALTKAKM